MKKIVLIGTVRPFGNKGDEAIYRTSIRLVREQYPNCKLSLATPVFETHKFFQFQKSFELVDEILPHPIAFMNTIFEKLFRFRPSNDLILRLMKFCSYNFSPYVPALTKYIVKKRFFFEYENSDLFIILGHPLEKAGMPTYLASYFFPKMILKKTTVAFPLSISLLKYSNLDIADKIIRKYIKMLLEKLDVILFREGKSMKYFLEDLHAKANVLLSADTAFLLEGSSFNSVLNKLSKQNVPFQKPAVAVCLRTDYFAIYRQEYVENEVTLLFRSIATLLDNIIDKFSVFFVPMTGGDYFVSKWVYNLLRNKKKAHIIDTKNMDCTEVKTLLSQMDFLITMRIHAAILAGSSNVPSISILSHHDFKSVGIMEDMNLSDYSLNFSYPRLVAKFLPIKIKHLCRNIDKVVNNMEERLPIIRSRAKKSGKILKYFL